MRQEDFLIACAMVGVLEALSGYLLLRMQRSESPNLVVGCVQVIWGGFCVWSLLAHKDPGWPVLVPLVYLLFLLINNWLGYRLIQEVRELEDPKSYRIPKWYGLSGMAFGVSYALLSGLALFA